MLTPGIAPELYVYIGGTFQTVITWWQDTVGGTPVDLTGKSADIQIRASVGASEILAEMSTTNGGITIPTPTNGQMNLLLTSEQTSVLKPRWCVYDVRITNASGTIDYLFKGRICFEEMSTHA